jgi:cytochrome c oxidase subunit 2
MDMVLYKKFSTAMETFCNAPQSWQIFFQEPATPACEGMIRFHNDTLFVLIVILFFVLYFQTRIVTFYEEQKEYFSHIFIHSTCIEVLWTIIPAVILAGIAIPSFSLLYSMDELTSPFLTVKCVGHQWYWSYEYSGRMGFDETFLRFDSYLISEDDLEMGQFRLLEVDRRLILPSKTHLRIITSSSDVIHCWAVPALGLKIDACPGRLNQTSLFIKRNGTFYGQCSEICGANHGFMPIAINVISFRDFVRWFSFKIGFGSNLESLLFKMENNETITKNK